MCARIHTCCAFHCSSFCLTGVYHSSTELHRNLFSHSLSMGIVLVPNSLLLHQGYNEYPFAYLLGYKCRLFSRCMSQRRVTGSQTMRMLSFTRRGQVISTVVGPEDSLVFLFFPIFPRIWFYQFLFDVTKFIGECSQHLCGVVESRNVRRTMMQWQQSSHPIL